MGWIAQLALLGVALIWGWTFVLVKESLTSVGPFTFLFYRFALALGLIGALFPGHLRGVPGRLWRQGGLIGVALFAGYWFQTWGLRYTSATHSGFITGLSVVLVPLLGNALFGQRVRAPVAWGAALSAVGLALIVFGNASDGLGLNLGDGLTLLCAVSFAFHILLISHFVRPQNYVPILVAQLGAVVALSALGMGAFEGWQWPRDGTAWKGIGLTAVLATAVAFWVQNRFQPHVSAAHTAILFASEPVFAALFGFWLLGERLGGAQWAGAGLILGAILVAQWPAAHAAPPSEG